MRYSRYRVTSSSTNGGKTRLHSTTTTTKPYRRVRSGKGFLNTLINSLPFELHVPGGYQYCGPGTKLEERLARGDPGINPLDAACKEHDITYSRYPNDLDKRHEADRVLENTAWDRVNSSDASLGEKAVAWTVTNAMKAKRQLGSGCAFSGGGGGKKKGGKRRVAVKRQRGSGVTFGRIIQTARKALPKNSVLRGNDSDQVLRDLASKSLAAVKQFKKSSANLGKCCRKRRVIPLPKVGGAFPLIPILSGLSALGSVAGSASNIVAAVKQILAAKKEIQSGSGLSERAISSGLAAGGNNLTVRRHKTGYGLYIWPKNT